MDKEQIKKQALHMETKRDLLMLLNQIKREEMADLDMADAFHPFTMHQINAYCNPNNTDGRYIQFQIKKKSGGFRQITAPGNKTFKSILYYLNILFKSVYTPSDFAMGFTEGRSVVDNANRHKKQNYVLNLDLKDFFPSIEQARVWARLQLPPFKFPRPVANVVAGLCCMRVPVEAEEAAPTDDAVEEGDAEAGDEESDNEEKVDYKKNFKYVLPQGAPTSPIITNMICDNLDRRLAGLAKRFGLRFSRYADDMSFSSMHNVFSEDGPFFKELHRIIEGQHFHLNEAKTRLQKFGSRKEVTGIVVSEKLNVSRAYIRNIRNLLYIWDRYGYGVAFSKFYPLYKANSGSLKKGTPDLANVLKGKLMYLKMVKGEEDPVFSRLYQKFSLLHSQLKEAHKNKVQGITYMKTWPLTVFEKENSQEITIYTTPDGQSTGSFYWNNEEIPISISESLSDEDKTNEDVLAISFCRDADGVGFLLIHRINEGAEAPSNLKGEVDDLNNDLDALLNTDNG